MDDRALWAQLRSSVYSHGTEVTIYSTPVTGWESPWFKQEFVLDQIDALYEQLRRQFGNITGLEEEILAHRKKFTYGFGASGNDFMWDESMLPVDDTEDDA